MEELLKEKYKRYIYSFTNDKDVVQECYQECFLKIAERNKIKKIKNIDGYWYRTVHNYFYGLKKTYYLDDADINITDESNEVNKLYEERVRLMENDLQRANSKNERYCKFIVQKYLEYGSIRNTSIKTEISRNTIKKAINDYINNTSIGEHGTHN